MEILSPVKNLEGAKVVIGAGADAIYFASPSFGARTKASIEVEEAKELIKYAKENGVETYAAFNTVVFDDELDQFFAELDELYQVGLDAAIVQDFSFINVIKQYYPDLDVHCSTQMHIHNSEATKYVETLGSNRIVVPREMNFERIKKIKQNSDVEVEAFVHGALCVSYSGQCYDSTLLDQKSANRGRCSQYCRMPQHTVYEPSGKIVTGGEYPLNLKDQNNIESLDLYADAGVDSLKIEGRLKSIDYAYLTTKAYREMLDSNKLTDLTNVYNREFTNGRINGTNGRELVNLYRPNNSGKKIGTIQKVEENKAKSLQYYPYVITVELEKGITINKLDNLRYTSEDYEDGQVVEQFKVLKEGIVLIFSKVKPEAGDDVVRTVNQEVMKKAKEAQTVTNRKEVKMNLFLKNSVLYYAIDGGRPINTEIKFEKPRNNPTTKDDILEKLAKTKNTPFDLVVESFRYNDDMFCQISKINNLRKQIIAELNEELNDYKFSNTIEKPTRNLKAELDDTHYYIELKTLDQYNAVKNFDVVCNVLINDVDLAIEIEPEENDYFVTPSVIYDDEMEKIEVVCEKFENIVVSEMGMFAKYAKLKNVLTNYTFNTTNYISQQTLVEEGADATILSIELNREKLFGLGNDASIVNIYGHIPVMIMDYCPINMRKTDTCGSCTKCRNDEYVLEDKLGRKFPLSYAGNNRIAMLSRKPISLLSKQDELEENGIHKFHIRFTLEDEHDVLDVLENLVYAENDVLASTNTGSYHKETL